MVSKHADKLKVAFLGIGELSEYMLKAFFNQRQARLGKVILYAHDQDSKKYLRLQDDLGEMKLRCPVSLEENLQKLKNPNAADLLIITADAANGVWKSLGTPAPFPLPATYEFTQNFQKRVLIRSVEEFKERNNNNNPISRETLERKISQKAFGSRTPEEVWEQYNIFTGLFEQGVGGTRLTEFLPYNIPIIRKYGEQLQGCQVPVLMYTNPIDVACYLFTVFSSMNHKLVLGNNEGDSVRLRKRIVPEAVAEIIGNEKSVKGVEKLLKSLKNDALVIGPHDDRMVPITSSITFYGKGGMPTNLRDLSGELDTVALQHRIAALAPQLLIEKKDTLYVWYEATERALKMMVNRELENKYINGPDAFRKGVTLDELPVLSTFIDPTVANVPDTIPHFTGLPVFRSWDGQNASVFVPYRDLSKDVWGERILNEKERQAFKKALVHGSKIILALKDLGVIDRLLEGEKKEQAANQVNEAVYVTQNAENSCRAIPTQHTVHTPKGINAPPLSILQEEQKVIGVNPEDAHLYETLTLYGVSGNTVEARRLPNGDLIARYEGPHERLKTFAIDGLYIYALDSEGTVYKWHKDVPQEQQPLCSLDKRLEDMVAGNGVIFGITHGDMLTITNTLDNRTCELPLIDIKQGKLHTPIQIGESIYVPVSGTDKDTTLFLKYKSMEEYRWAHRIKNTGDRVRQILSDSSSLSLFFLLEHNGVVLYDFFGSNEPRLQIETGCQYADVLLYKNKGVLPHENIPVLLATAKDDSISLWEITAKQTSRLISTYACGQQITALKLLPLSNKYVILALAPSKAYVYNNHEKMQMEFTIPDYEKLLVVRQDVWIR